MSLVPRKSSSNVTSKYASLSLLAVNFLLTIDGTMNERDSHIDRSEAE